jgi:hypothetical protein
VWQQEQDGDVNHRAADRLAAPRQWLHFEEPSEAERGGPKAEIGRVLGGDLAFIEASCDR